MFKEDKNLYETIFNILPDTIILIDNKGILVGVNDRMEEWLSYKKEEVVGQHLLKLPMLTTKSKIIVAKKFADRMRGKEVAPYEIDFKTKDGATVTGLVRAAAMNDDKGEISHDLALITDTSKEKFLATQIADAERKYEYLFDNLPYGFAYHKMVFDKDKKPVDYIFEEVNEKFETMTSLKAANIVGKKVTDVILDIKEDEFDWIAKYGEVVTKRQPIIFESFSAALNKWFKIAAYSPEEGYFVTIFYDITEDIENEKQVVVGTNELGEKLKELARMNKMMEHRETKLQELRDRLKKS